MHPVPVLHRPGLAIGTFSATTAPTGWSAYGGGLNFANRTVGVRRPATTTLCVEPVPDGNNVGVIFLMDNQANQTFFANLEAGLQQTLTATLQTRRQYVLRVDVGNIANDINAPFLFGGFPNYRIDLMAGTNCSRPTTTPCCPARDGSSPRPSPSPSARRIRSSASRSASAS